MEGPERTESGYTAAFTFPPSFIGFQGHFPTSSVLPGACQVQCAVTTIQLALGRAVRLREIMIAKYVAPVLPEDRIVCAVGNLTEKDGELVCRFMFTKNGERVSELKLRLELENRFERQKEKELFPADRRCAGTGLRRGETPGPLQ